MTFRDLDFVALSGQHSVALLAAVGHDVGDGTGTLVGEDVVADPQVLDGSPTIGSRHEGSLPEALTAGLDRAGGRIRATHEGDWAGGVAPLRELLLRGAQPRQVDAGARAAA